MTRSNRWRVALFALCAVFMFAVLATAFVNIPLGTANADGLALRENTATYNIVNDSANSWLYDRQNNIWTNVINSSTKTLTINITEPGDVAFEYLAMLGNSNKQGGKQYTFNLSDFSIKVSKAGIQNNIVNMHGEKMPDYKLLVIKDMQKGDSITFVHKGKNEDEDYVKIKGLSTPAKKQVNVNISAEANGKIDYNGEKKQAHNLSLDDGYEHTFTAVPDGGYVFKYWKDEEGNVVSRDATVTISLLSDVTYIAEFVSADLCQITYNADIFKVNPPVPEQETDEEKAEREKSAIPDGWHVVDMSKAKGKATTLVTIEFIGEKYFYGFIASHFVRVSWNNNSLNAYLDDESLSELSFGYYDNFDEPTTQASPQWNDGYYHLVNEGYHKITLEYDATDLSTEEDVVILKDFELLDAPKEGFVDIDVQYNDKYGTVYIDGKPIEPGTNQVPKDRRVAISATYQPVQSAIDPEQTVNVRWDGFYTELSNVTHESTNSSVSKNPGMIWPDPSFNMTFSDGHASGPSSFTMSGNILQVRMREYAPAARVSYTARADGGMPTGEVMLTNGQTINFDYGKAYDISVLISSFEGIKQDFSVKIDNVLQDGQEGRGTVSFVEDAGRTYFAIQNITEDTSITVFYSTEGYYDSAEFTFNIKFTDDTPIEKGLLVDGATDITVENDEFVPWIFSATHSSNGQRAYINSNSGENGYYGISVSSLKFTVQGAGILAFDFQMAYESNWLMYNIGEPISTSLQVGTLSGASDTNNEQVWTPTDKIIARAWNSTKTISNNQYFYWFVGEYAYGKTTYMLDDGWAHVEFSVGTDQQETDVYICFYRNSDYYGHTPPFGSPADYCAIRNVGFFKGNTTVNFSANNNDGGTVEAQSTEKLTNGQQIALGSRVTFTATENAESGYKFYGWVDENDNLISTQTPYTVSITKSKYTIKAIFGKTNQYAIRKNGKFYEDIESAMQDATNGDILYALHDIAIENSFTIKKDVSLIFPVNERGDYTDVGTAKTAINRVAWTKADQYKQFTISVSSNATLTIEGSLYLGGVLHYPDQSAQAHTSGKYHEMKLDGKVIVAEGGAFDVCGLVTGEGSIEVKSGGKLYQPFLILDYAGGTNTQGLFVEGQTPFKRYAMVNIQCTGGYTLNYGAVLYGHASLYFWSSVTTIDQPFITYEGASDVDANLSTALIIMKDGSTLTSKYDEKHTRVAATDVVNTEDIGMTTITINGGARAGYMQFPLDINTAGVAFSIPYNYQIILENGDYSIDYDYKLMPGAKIWVKNGANLTLNADFYVYDGLVQTKMSGKGYPSASQLVTAGYATNANFVVDGALYIKDHVFLGAIQTTGATGEIHVDAGATLTGEIVDGALTGYDCNYATFHSSARIYGNVLGKGTVFELEAGRDYKAVSGDTWTLPTTEVTYEKVNYLTGDGNVDKDTYIGKHPEAHDLATATTAAVENMTGVWKAVHLKQGDLDKHSFDWSYAEGDELPSEGKLFTVLHRSCTELGCDHAEEKYLLHNFGAFDSVAFEAKEITDEQLLAWLRDKIGQQAIEATFEHGTLKDVSEMPYDVTVKLSNALWYAEGNVYNADAVLKLEITQYEIKQSDVQETLAQVTYNGKAYKPQVTITHNGVTLELTTDYTVEYGDNINAGQGSVTIKGVRNYSGEVTLNFEIAKASVAGGMLSVKPEVTFTYNGQAQTPAEEQLSLTIDGIEGEITFEVTGATDNTNHGTAHVTVKGTGNFEGELTADFTIAKKNIVVKADPITATYGTDEELTWTVEDGQLESPDQKSVLSVQLQREPGNNVKVGGYAITGTGTADNYNITVQPSTYTINPFDITVTLVKQQWAKFDGTPKSAMSGAQYFNVAEALPYEDSKDDLQIVLTATGTNWKEGGYDIDAVCNNANYKATFEGTSGAFEIAKAEVTVKANGVTTPQNDELVKDFTYTVTAGRFYGSDEDTFKAAIQFECALQDTATVTSADIVLKYKEPGFDMPNYTIALQNGTYEVTETIYKDVKFEGAEHEYDGNTYTLAVSGNVPDHATIKYTVGGVEFEGAKAAGTYVVQVEITVEGHASKYSNTATLKINKKAIKLVADPITAIYGEGEKPLTWHVDDTTPLVSGEVAADVLSVTISRVPGNDVKQGGYAISGNATADNYDITEFVGAIYTINPKSISEARVEVSKSYTYTGKPIVPQIGDVTLTLSGYSDFTFTLSAVEGSNVNAGEVELTVTGTGNYEGSVTTSFTIDRAEIDKVQVEGSYTYGGQPIEATLKVTAGELVLSSDDYDVAYTGDHTAAGTANFTVTAKDGRNFKGSIAGSFAIGKRQVTLQLIDQKVTYTAARPVISFDKDVAWTVKDGEIAGDDNLNVTLGSSALQIDVGEYVIDTADWSNSNYQVQFEGKNSAKIKVEKATVTVTVQPAQSVYGNALAQLEATAVGVFENDLTTVNILKDYIELGYGELTERSARGTYDIVCTQKTADGPKNYKIVIVNDVKYEVKARPVGVQISNVNEVYEFGKAYNLDGVTWKIISGDLAAWDQDNEDVLAISLSMPAIDGAGEYDIVHTCGNQNYDVEFTDGKYNVAKKDISGEEVFILMVGDTQITDDQYRVKFVRAALSVQARALYREGTQDIQLATVLSQNTLSALGEYQIEVSIADSERNYTGKKTFKVVLENEDGYSQHLIDVLGELATLVDGKTAVDITLADYELVRNIAQKLWSLDAADREAGAIELDQYQQFIVAYNAIIEADEQVSETAKAVADAPIQGFWKALAVANALAALGYVVLKGVKRI